MAEASNASYKHVPTGDDDRDEDFQGYSNQTTYTDEFEIGDDNVSDIDDEEDHNENADSQRDGVWREPSDHDELAPPRIERPRSSLEWLFRWDQPWLLSISVTLFLAFPLLLWVIIDVYSLSGRLWPSAFFCLHLVLCACAARYMIPDDAEFVEVPSKIITSFLSLLDIALFGFVYPFVFERVIDDYFIDHADGSVVWPDMYRDFRIFQGMSIAIAASRFWIGIVAILARCCPRMFRDCTRHAELLDKERWCCTRVFCWCCNTNCCCTLVYRLERCGLSWSDQGKRQFKRRWRVFFEAMIVVYFLLLLCSILGALLHWGTWFEAPTRHDKHCNMLDTTECILPFPSMHYMKKDETTETGWRVHLHEKSLPPLKGGDRIDPSFLNELDGFSTMAPMLFYMKGLAKVQDAIFKGKMTPSVQLPSADHIDHSLSQASVTLLVDVQANNLVPHFAEIDYFDTKHPVVMVFPASPLKHNTHYALAVVNAIDIEGKRIKPTDGLQDVLYYRDSEDPTTMRYHDVLIPALHQAAPWIDLDKDKDALQLLFDFRTISESSQLGTIRDIRDATIAQISSWDWQDHVQITKTEDHVCLESDPKFDPELRHVARVIHGTLDVPWFLNEQKHHHHKRQATLNATTLNNTAQISVIGQEKFQIIIPCSLRDAALNIHHTTVLTGVIEFGHGVFGSRSSAKYDPSLMKMAHEEGYLIMAMDWRGMSQADMPVVIKTLLSQPRNFRALRDNMIQGYAAKLAMQHFRKYGNMLDMDFMKFHHDEYAFAIPRALSANSIFFGYSQGAILGAAYITMAREYFDRAILGAPGTPFAMILSRSQEFLNYNKILLLNFHHGRHIRILLSLLQMDWDTVEASGWMAEFSNSEQPQEPPFPPTLIQAGAGDVEVPIRATEALARAMKAKTLPNAPNSNIFGVEHMNDDPKTAYDPYVALTELLFQKEWQSLPKRDVPLEDQDNNVHACVRHDPSLVSQRVTFINTARVVNACGEGCVRESSDACETYY